VLALAAGVAFLTLAASQRGRMGYIVAILLVELAGVAWVCSLFKLSFSNRCRPWRRRFSVISARSCSSGLKRISKNGARVRPRSAAGLTPAACAHLRRAGSHDPGAGDGAPGGRPPPVVENRAPALGELAGSHSSASRACSQSQTTAGDSQTLAPESPGESLRRARARGFFDDRRRGDRLGRHRRHRGRGFRHDGDGRRPRGKTSRDLGRTRAPFFEIRFKTGMNRSEPR